MKSEIEHHLQGVLINCTTWSMNYNMYISMSGHYSKSKGKGARRGGQSGDNEGTERGQRGESRKILIGTSISIY